jgi:hypothetical protein
MVREIGWEGVESMYLAQGLSERGNEPSGFIKGEEFFDELNDC